MEIQDRTLNFSIRIAKLIRKISKDISLSIISSQLLRSATSIGANMREADSASSRKDFINKVFIAKKEAQETEYWLELLKGAEFINNEDNKKELNYLLAECREIVLILAAILRKSKTLISN
ncbi:MAG: four helix bundle protein [Candidatus Margulisbacteria bacterium]|nr:four helix bundle protein [Candidatus Margulisiibacteriota bacterium]